MTANRFYKGILSKKPGLAIFLALFIDFLAFGLIIPVVPVLFKGTNTDLFDPTVTEQHRTFLYGIIMGAYAFFTFLGAPLLGSLSDRIGRKKVLLITNFSNMMGYLLFAIGIIDHNFWLCFVGRAVPGLFGGSLFIVQSAIADISTEDTKTKNFGMVGVAFGLGFIFGAVLGGVLGDPNYHSSFGPTIPFFTAASLNVLNLGFILFFLPETLFEYSKKKIHAFSGFQNLYLASTDKDLRMVYSVIFIMTCGFAFFIQFLPLYLTGNYGFTQMEVGLMFAAIGVYAALSQGVVLRFISKWLIPDQVLLYLMPVFTVSYLLLLIPDTKLGLFATMPLMIIFQGTLFPNTLTMISDKADRRSQGRYIGINQSLHSFGAALAAFAAAPLAGLHDSFILTFGAGCTGVAYMIFLFYLNKKRKANRTALQSGEVEQVASVEDLEVIRELLRKAGLPYDDVGEPNQHFFLYRFKKLVMGSIGLQKAGQFGLLRSLSVTREFRKKHLGEKLVKKLTSFSLESGVRELYLITNSAKEYFESLGFQEVSIEKVPVEIRETQEYTELYSETANVMVKALGND